MKRVLAAFAGEAIGDKPVALILIDYTCRFICGTTLAVAAYGLSYQIQLINSPRMASATNGRASVFEVKHV